MCFHGTSGILIGLLDIKKSYSTETISENYSTLEKIINLLTSFEFLSTKVCHFFFFFFDKYFINIDFLYAQKKRLTL